MVDLIVIILGAVTIALSIVSIGASIWTVLQEKQG